MGSAGTAGFLSLWKFGTCAANFRRRYSYDMLWYVMVCYAMVCYGMVCCGMV